MYLKRWAHPKVLLSTYFIFSNKLFSVATNLYLVFRLDPNILT